MRAPRRAHLIEPGTAARRWRLRDLVRLYARRLTTPAERQPAVGRLLQVLAGSLLAGIAAYLSPRFLT